MTSLLRRDVDQSRWPDVMRVPRSPLRAKVAAALLRRAATGLGLRVDLPDGTVLGPSDGPRMRVHRPSLLFQRLGAGGLIGFGESYQAGDWDCADLPGLVELLADNAESLVPPMFQRLRRFYVASFPGSQDNNPDNAAANISRHYDLSNDLFRLFLDQTMTYSAADFAGGTPDWSRLAAAQRRKIDRLLDATEVKAGTRVLEIGTGWGELAVRAAERGATVDTITLSAQQLDHARRRAADAGVAERIDARLCDYRQLATDRTYDVVLSIEMIEAVGERYWPTYFATLDRLLAPGGRVGLQAITMAHDRMLATRRTYTWIQKYIFPGGLIPSVRAIEDNLRDHTSMSIVDRYDFGTDYASTLRLWRDRFNANVEAVRDLGFDDIFRRTWDFYLAYSQAGFASGYLDVHQFTLRSPR